jgi:hypothetical protein
VQGTGVTLAERPEFIDAERNVNPPSYSGRDAWTSLQWDAWGGATATGRGSYAWNTPTQSDVLLYPVSITLDQPVACGDLTVYTRITGTFIGTPPDGMGSTLVNGVLPYTCAPATASAPVDEGADAAIQSCDDTTLFKSKYGRVRASNILSTKRISCKLARNLLRAAYRKGPLKVIKKERPSGGGRPILWVKGGWRCTTGAGGAACWSATNDQYNEVATDGAERGPAVTASVT